VPSPAERAWVEAIRRGLTAWYRRSHRDLPWRRSADPYRVWLSEAMLQQTRVETVVPYYERFLERFPSVEALARADEQQVLKAWEGLGYYSRARNLKRAAEQVVRDHGGALPRDARALTALPGIGRYTAGAIRSIAFGERAPLADGNVRRVLARLRAQPRPSEREVWALAEQLVPEREPGAFNQALMELGATLCLPRQPRCPGCPVRAQCAAAAAGRPEDFPAPSARRAPREVRAVAGLLRRRDGALLLLRRPSRGLLGGLWEVPTLEGGSAAELAVLLRERTGLGAEPGASLGELRHVFTHRALTLRVLELRRRGGRLRSDPSDARWCGPAERGALPLSRLTQKVVELERSGARQPRIPGLESRG
jgi:A/G-specific adenine glycosylase